MKAMRLLLILLLSSSVIHVFGQPTLSIEGAEICLTNNGPNDNCGSTENRINVLNWDETEGYSLIDLNAPFTEDLRLGMEVPYIDVIDSPVEAFIINGNFLEIHFFNAQSIFMDMSETHQVGIYFSQGRTGLFRDCKYGHPLTSYIQNDQLCNSVAVYLGPLNKVNVQTGIGTVLVIDELQDTTSLLPIDDINHNSRIAYGDPFLDPSLFPLTYQDGAALRFPEYYHFFKDAMPSCIDKHRASTDITCLERVSLYSQIYICGNFVVVKEPGVNNPPRTHFFEFGKNHRVYIYIDHQTNEYVIWVYGNCKI